MTLTFEKGTGLRLWGKKRGKKETLFQGLEDDNWDKAKQKLKTSLSWGGESGTREGDVRTYRKETKKLHTLARREGSTNATAPGGGKKHREMPLLD